MQPIELILGNRAPRGIYRQYAETAAAGAASLAFMAAFRWTDTARLAVILRTWVTVNVVTAVTAQRMDPLLLYIARSYTVRDSTNATSVAINAAMAKLRTTQFDSLLVGSASGNFDVTSAPGTGLTGGTRTLDTNPIGSKGFGQQAFGALGTAMEGDIYTLPTQGSAPIVLQAQAPGGGEGILLRWGSTALATGSVTIGFGVEWIELNAA